MPVIEANFPMTEQRVCPLCDTPLDPQNSDECSRCDWVAYYRAPEHQIGTPRDTAAMLMSIIPGLGHIYKGHKLTGGLLMLGGLFAVFACGLVATATAGFGLLLLPLYWAGVMMQVYWIEDRAAPKTDQE